MIIQTLCRRIENIQNEKQKQQTHFCETEINYDLELQNLKTK